MSGIIQRFACLRRALTIQNGIRAASVATGGSAEWFGSSSPMLAPVCGRALSSRAASILRYEEGSNVKVSELAARVGQEVVAVQALLDELGEESSASSAVSSDAAELIAAELGLNFEIIRRMKAGKRRVRATIGEGAEKRPPVVAVMGHVDHGKTTLLDALRKTSVASGEAGGITQHIGAFSVDLESQLGTVTFLDTPGHAAFKAMRERSSYATDLAVLVVASDDGVMPQTVEAYEHIKSSGVPFVVALTKSDKPDVSHAKVTNQLADLGIYSEEMGGDVPVLPVGVPPKGKAVGLNKLVETLSFQAELQGLCARQEGVAASGVVVEAKLDRGRGIIATVLLQEGTLTPGSHITIGNEWGKIRTMRDWSGKMLKKALPSMPVEIDGLKGLPEAGDSFGTVETEQRAKQISKLRQTKTLGHGENGNPSTGGITAADKEGEAGVSRPLVPIILKSDVMGTGEALRDAILGLESEAVGVKILSLDVGNINEADVAFAKATDASILAFNVRGNNTVMQSALASGVKIVSNKIIYKILEEVSDLLRWAAPMQEVESVSGEAQVLKTFVIQKKSGMDSDIVIAGCRVKAGRIYGTTGRDLQNAQRGKRAASSTEYNVSADDFKELVRRYYRVTRKDAVVFEGECKELKHHAQAVDAVGKNTECGLTFRKWNAVQEGDSIECIEVHRIPADVQEVVGGGFKVVT